MDTLGLVIHDEQTFLSKVVSEGTEQGIFTRDRSDEIIRVSVAMSNKYVVQKEVDFRSSDELAKVQETILKLIGVGLEIKAKGDVDSALTMLMDGSPVEFFRLAYTRIEKLRHRWNKLLQEHTIKIFVSMEEYECLSDFTCQRLANMSIFSESEVHTISSLTLPDELFSTLGLVEYYESECERYEFILRLKEILPFSLLNTSPNVQAENLSEVDSIREALINTLVISAYTEAPDPVAVTMEDVRRFLGTVDLNEISDLFPEDVENAVLDVIQELGEDLDEQEGSLLAKEIIRTAQKFLETIVAEWDTINSPSENTFFKRWCRLVILSGAPDPLFRILTQRDMLDEFDFEMLLTQMMNLPEDQVLGIVDKLPWNRMTPDQIIRLFHSVEQYQEIMASQVELEGFSAPEFIDLLEGLSPEALHNLVPALKKPFAEAEFSMEDLEILAGLPNTHGPSLLRLTTGPVDYEAEQVFQEYKEGSDNIRQVLFHSCISRDFFSALFEEAWSMNAALVKSMVKTVPATEIGPLLLSANAGMPPKLVQGVEKQHQLEFDIKEVNSLFKALPLAKRKAAAKFFNDMVDLTKA
jgi:hypothetical protein